MSVGELMPCAGLKFCDWRPQVSATRRFGRSAQSVSTVTGPGYWVARIETGFLTLAQAREWSAFLSRREGDGVSFTAWRSWRTKPKGEMSIADGSIGVVPSPGDNTLALSGVGNYTAQKGDMISYRTLKGGYYCGEVLQNAFSESNSITLNVWPRPVAAHATPEVKRVQALAEFYLLNSPPYFEDYSGRSLVLEARQTDR